MLAETATAQPQWLSPSHLPSILSERFCMFKFARKREACGSIRTGGLRFHRIKLVFFCNGRESDRTANYNAYSNETPCFGLFQVLIVYNNVSNINNIIDDSNSVIKNLRLHYKKKTVTETTFWTLLYLDFVHRLIFNDALLCFHL
jgi:hypothetical protein